MIRYISNTHVFIALSAVALTAGTALHLNAHKQLLPYLAFVFFATLFDYNLHRFVKARFNIGKLEKNSWAKSNETTILVIGILSLTGTLISFIIVPNQIKLLLCIAGLITMVYSFPFHRLGLHHFDIRRITGLKNVLIASIWTLVTYYIPLILTNPYQDSQLPIFQIVSRFVFILAITLPFDIKDMDEDREMHLKTVPNVVGSRVAISISNVLFLIFIFLSFLQFSSKTEFSILLANGITGLISLWIINSKTLKKKRYYYPIYLDGILLFYGFALIITT